MDILYWSIIYKLNKTLKQFLNIELKSLPSDHFFPAFFSFLASFWTSQIQLYTWRAQRQGNRLVSSWQRIWITFTIKSGNRNVWLENTEWWQQHYSVHLWNLELPNCFHSSPPLKPLADLSNLSHFSPQPIPFLQEVEALNWTN